MEAFQIIKNNSTVFLKQTLPLIHMKTASYKQSHLINRKESLVQFFSNRKKQVNYICMRWLVSSQWQNVHYLLLNALKVHVHTAKHNFSLYWVLLKLSFIQAWCNSITQSTKASPTNFKKISLNIQQNLQLQFLEH